MRIDRLLVKPVPVAVKMMPDAEMEPLYDGAKKMILVDDVDNRQFLCELVESMWEELPEKKKKNRQSENRFWSSWRKTWKLRKKARFRFVRIPV